MDAGLSAETRVKHADRTAAAVQDRLCAILQDVANKDKREDIKPKPKRNKEMHNDHNLFAQTTHTVIQAEGQLRCSTCGTVAGRTMRVKNDGGKPSVTSYITSAWRPQELLSTQSSLTCKSIHPIVAST